MKQHNDPVWKTEPYSSFQKKTEDFHLDVPKAFYRDARIRYSPDSLRDCFGADSCWPVYAIRGRPVSPELALEIIRKTDHYRFSICPSDREPDNRIERMFQHSGVFPPDDWDDSNDMIWFPYENWARCGRCHPDGYIGINGESCKWPTLRNLLDPWVYLIQNITLEMDLVAVVTEVEEWSGDLDDSIPFEQKIACGFLVQGDTVTLLTRHMARELFRRYDSLYGVHRSLGPLTMADMERFVRLWKQERTGMCTEGLAIAALGEHGPEQVTDLETTEHELLFVMADYVDEEGIRALSRCRARLRGEGKTPFFIQCGCGYQAHVPETANPFDLLIDCDFDHELPLKLPVEIIASLLLGRDLVDLDAEEVLPVLRRPGSMLCFEKSASWEGRPRPTFEALCHALEELKKSRCPLIRPGDDLRVFVQMLCSPNIGLDEVERCARSLAEDEQRDIFFRFQCEFRDDLPDHTIVVRGLIGSMENREAPLWQRYSKGEPEPFSGAEHDDLMGAFFA